MSSLARKLTPSDVAQPKIKLKVSQQSYCHENQATLGKTDLIYMTTFNATQTFDSHGKPNDKDND